LYVQNNVLSTASFGLGTLKWERREIVEHRNDGSRETVFTMKATPLKFGPGCSEEIGWEVKQLRMSRVMLVSSPAKG
jgi:hypothetical protein